MLDLFKGRNDLEDKGFLFRILQLAREEYLWQLEGRWNEPQREDSFQYSYSKVEVKRILSKRAEEGKEPNIIDSIGDIDVTTPRDEPGMVLHSSFPACLQTL